MSADHHEEGPIYADRFILEAGYGSLHDGDILVWSREPEKAWLAGPVSDADLDRWLAEKLIEPVQHLISGEDVEPISVGAAERLFVMGALEAHDFIAQHRSIPEESRTSEGRLNGVLELQEMISMPADPCETPDRIGLFWGEIARSGKSFAIAAHALGCQMSERVAWDAAQNWAQRIIAEKTNRLRSLRELDEMMEDLGSPSPAGSSSRFH